MNPQAHRIGRYEIKDKLGEGGMGVVYRAVDSELMREVAVKVIRREALGGEDDALERFDREAKAAGQLKHPAIVTIYDRGEWNGLPYLVMELVEGETFDDLLRRGSLDHAAVLNVLSQVASGVDYAHQRGIIHRDLKPANILVQHDGTAKILDFGIAKISSGGGQSASATQVGMLVGSPAYMPPERFLGDDSTRSTDIWALGVTAFEALTGRRPFQGKDWQAVAYQIVNEPTPDPVQWNPNLPPSAGDVLRRVLAKAPDQRFTDCSGFTAALMSAYRPPQQAPPPSAEPTRVEELPPPPPQPETPKSRGPLAIGVGIAAGVVLALGVWLSGVLDSPVPRKTTGVTGPIVTEAPKPILQTETGVMLLVTASNLPAFYIDKTEVSVAAYRRFCNATGAQLPDPAAAPDLPVAGITFDQAAAFASWAGKRLPTAEEWENAARGNDGRVFPWGSEFDPSRANLAGASATQLAPVDSFPNGASPAGALHMLGNVWEWTATAVTPPAERFSQYAQTFSQLTPPLSRDDIFRQVRGGSVRFAPSADEARSLLTDFISVPARAQRPDIGFRCARTP